MRFVLNILFSAIFKTYLTTKKFYCDEDGKKYFSEKKIASFKQGQSDDCK